MKYISNNNNFQLVIKNLYFKLINQEKFENFCDKLGIDFRARSPLDSALDKLPSISQLYEQVQMIQMQITKNVQKMIRNQLKNVLKIELYCKIELVNTLYSTMICKFIAKFN